MILQYSYYNDRGIVYEGSFREQKSSLFKIGDWFLTHHVCSKCNVPILQQIKDITLAYTFNDEPIHDFVVEGGGSYKSNLLHYSLYDLIIHKT